MVIFLVLPILLLAIGLFAPNFVNFYLIANNKNGGRHSTFITIVLSIGTSLLIGAGLYYLLSIMSSYNIGEAAKLLVLILLGYALSIVQVLFSDKKKKLLFFNTIFTPVCYIGVYIGLTSLYGVLN